MTRIASRGQSFALMRKQPRQFQRFAARIEYQTGRYLPGLPRTSPADDSGSPTAAPSVWLISLDFCLLFGPRAHLEGLRKCPNNSGYQPSCSVRGDPLASTTFPLVRYGPHDPRPWPPVRQ